MWRLGHLSEHWQPGAISPKQNNSLCLHSSDLWPIGSQLMLRLYEPFPSNGILTVLILNRSFSADHKYCDFINTMAMLYPEECFVSLFPILCLYFHPFFFYVLWALNKIDVPVRAEHATVTYSKHFEQLQVSTLIKAPAHKRAFLITVGSSKDL